MDETVPGDVIAPPDADRLVWRELAEGNLTSLTALSATCLRLDGGLPLAATEWYVRSRYLSTDMAAASIGAFTESGTLAACSALRAVARGAEVQVECNGQVHPDWRGRGHGTFLMQWNGAQALRLARHFREPEAVRLILTCEWLSTGAQALFEKAGYRQIFAEDVLRYALDQPLHDPLPRDDLDLLSWTEKRSPLFFEVYAAAFRERPGNPEWTAAQWIEWITGDDDFLPGLTFLAMEDGEPVGYIATAEDWIIQVGVRPDRRRRGIATTLITRVLHDMAARGRHEILLDVNTNNPSAAALYVALGFEIVGRRARFARVLAPPIHDWLAQ